MNVLNSYKLDSGVDGLIKELLAEVSLFEIHYLQQVHEVTIILFLQKEKELERSKERISELEGILP